MKTILSIFKVFAKYIFVVYKNHSYNHLILNNDYRNDPIFVESIIIPLNK